MSLNLAWIVENAAREYGGETAQIAPDGQRTTYAELRERVQRFGAALAALGVQPGDKVAMILPNIPEFTVVYFGILHTGATVVPLNVMSVATEIGYYLENSEAVALVTWDGYWAAAQGGFDTIDTCRHLIVVTEGAQSATPEGALEYGRMMREARSDGDSVATMPDDTAVILYTSGTTGRPKGAELTHFNLYCNAQWCSERGQSVMPKQLFCFGPGQVGLATLPLYHSFGQTCVQNSMLFNGAAVSYLPRFHPDAALDQMARDRVTYFAGVPTMYFALLHHPTAAARDLSSLKYCMSGGAPMPVEVLNEFDARFGTTVMEGYGLSETSPVACTHTPGRPRKVGTVGWPILGCEIRIHDTADRRLAAGETGEVVMRGVNIMKGYYRNPAATAEAMRGGWFHSGDIGVMDEDGYLAIVDRKKDMIIRGGFNVYPREVEEILYGHPSVREAAVLGAPDAEHGEEVKAVLALKEGTTATADEIVTYCKERMAAYKYPRLVEFLPELPKGPTGKILKRALRDA
jgi:long-chain acyl-CoA synthetase